MEDGCGASLAKRAKGFWKGLLLSLFKNVLAQAAIVPFTSVMELKGYKDSR